MTQTVSVSCKLQVPPELHREIDRTLEAFAQACNLILEVANSDSSRGEAMKCHNTTKLHHLTYANVRARTGLKANHACQAIRRVVTAIKGQKQVHTFRPTSISLDARTFRYWQERQTVGVTLLNGRVNFSLKIGNYQLALLKGQTPTSAVLVKRKNGDYYIQIAVDLPTPPTGKTPKVIGVDLGRRNIATTSTGKSWDGAQLQATRDRYAKVRASVQRKRTKGAKRLLKRLSGREQRFQKNINHTISRQLVNEAVELNAGLALEDLTGIRQRVRNKGPKQRRQGHSWAFYQLRQFVTYKAALAGVEVILVQPHYTSKTCSHCFWLGNRQAKSFACINSGCGWSGDADYNASRNIAILGALVNRPGDSTMFCTLVRHSSLHRAVAS